MEKMKNNDPQLHLQTPVIRTAWDALYVLQVVQIKDPSSSHAAE